MNKPIDNVIEMRTGSGAARQFIDSQVVRDLEQFVRNIRSGSIEVPDGVVLVFEDGSHNTRVGFAGAVQVNDIVSGLEIAKQMVIIRLMNNTK